ncbi:hypothetical protein [Streptomyces prunicolor]|uniref:hypothetical protein n=1 Tax=Streptomyces prunicolor TaxID=67348 RepID=UPI00131A3D80|nr:hypothetical protein [Streptomyces prunicolor]
MLQRSNVQEGHEAVGRSEDLDDQYAVVVCRTARHRKPVHGVSAARKDHAAGTHVPAALGVEPVEAGHSVGRAVLALVPTVTVGLS